nr:uncharacterized protein LOC128688148 [Cherax quadricarinatus]
MSHRKDNQSYLTTFDVVVLGTGAVAIFVYIVWRCRKRIIEALADAVQLLNNSGEELTEATHLMSSKLKSQMNNTNQGNPPRTSTMGQRNPPRTSTMGQGNPPRTLTMGQGSPPRTHTRSQRNVLRTYINGRWSPPKIQTRGARHPPRPHSMGQRSAFKTHTISVVVENVNVKREDSAVTIVEENVMHHKCEYERSSRPVCSSTSHQEDAAIIVEELLE